MSSKRKWDEPGDGAPDTKVPKVEGAEGSPAPPTEADSKKALEAAAEVAARLAAQYGAKSSTSEPYVAGARETNDPEFVKDIEINDLRNRYLLTKGPTQQQILADTGASVVTKGVWYPDKSMNTDKDPPLYLHITAETAEKLAAGVEAVEKLIAQELGPLLDQNRFRDRDAPRERRKWPEEKVPIELETLRNFNVRAKVVGPGGLFVKFIQQETQTRVQIKGMGSGFVETDTGRESEDPMHIHVTGPDQVMVDKATEMAKDLLVVVKEEWAKSKAVLEQSFQQQYQQQQYGGGYNNYSQQQYPQQQYPGYQAYAGGVTAPLPAGEAPPPPPTDGAPPPPPSDAPPPPPSGGAAPVTAQQAGSTATPEEWSKYWNSLDAASQAYYTQYYSQQYASPAGAYGSPAGYQGSPAGQAYGQGSPAGVGGGAGDAKGGKGTYGAVPPPPGL